MPSLLRVAFIATLLVLLWSPVSRSEDGVMYIEGHVFGARSHDPVQGVQVSASAPLDELCTPEDECGRVSRAVTDRNGFYQLPIRDADSLRSDTIFVYALCVVTNADGEFITSEGSSIEAHPVEAGLILRRDMYIRLPRILNLLGECDPTGQRPGPDRVPAIGPPPDPVVIPFP